MAIGNNPTWQLIAVLANGTKHSRLFRRVNIQQRTVHHILAAMFGNQVMIGQDGTLFVGKQRGHYFIVLKSPML